MLFLTLQGANINTTCHRGKSTITIPPFKHSEQRSHGWRTKMKQNKTVGSTIWLTHSVRCSRHQYEQSNRFLWIFWKCNGNNAVGWYLMNCVWVMLDFPVYVWNGRVQRVKWGGGEVIMWWMAAGCLGVWQLGWRSCCRSWLWCCKTLCPKAEGQMVCVRVLQDG